MLLVFSNNRNKICNIEIHCELIPNTGSQVISTSLFKISLLISIFQKGEIINGRNNLKIYGGSEEKAERNY